MRPSRGAASAGRQPRRFTSFPGLPASKAGGGLAGCSVIRTPPRIGPPAAPEDAGSLLSGRSSRQKFPAQGGPPPLLLRCERWHVRWAWRAGATRLRPTWARLGRPLPPARGYPEPSKPDPSSNQPEFGWSRCCAVARHPPGRPRPASPPRRRTHHGQHGSRGIPCGFCFLRLPTAQEVPAIRTYSSSSALTNL